MAESKFDQRLQIRTTGLREWRDKSLPYNRYEPTPYRALEKLFQAYKLNEEAEVVDFGVGRGRVSFYIHHRFGIPVTGIEVNETTLDEALDNKKSYRRLAKHIEAPIRLHYGLAEQYEIQQTDNCFYFFNPFSIKIFKKVVHNIISSVKETPRTVDIILYYPLPEYKKFLRDKTDFQLIDRIKIKEENDAYAKFLIYRLNENE